MSSLEKLISIRRYLHQHPELSNEEVETHAYLIEKLKELGHSPKVVARTGIKVTIEGEAPGRAVGYRADIDALPIEEANEIPYKSLNKGKMHACGHDVHTTIALGLAERFAEKPPEKGSVTILFQPAEEGTPVTEPIGAEKMVLEGVLEDPPLDAIFALHCMPGLEVGLIGYTGGSVWAESTLVSIKIEGKSSHAAYPFEGVDSVVVAAQVVLGLQAVVSRGFDARDSIVLTIGSLTAGKTYNVIAPSAHLLGTMRTLNQEVTAEAKRRIQTLVEGTSAAYGARGQVEFIDGARLTENDLALEEWAVGRLKKHGVGVAPFKAQMASEDFASFSSRIRGCYLFLGIENKALGIESPLHTSTFNVDEQSLQVGTDAMEHLLRDFLNEI